MEDDLGRGSPGERSTAALDRDEVSPGCLFSAFDPAELETMAASGDQDPTEGSAAGDDAKGSAAEIDQGGGGTDAEERPRAGGCPAGEDDEGSRRLALDHGEPLEGDSGAGVAPRDEGAGAGYSHSEFCATPRHGLAEPALGSTPEGRLDEILSSDFREGFHGGFESEVVGKSSGESGELGEERSFSLEDARACATKE